LKRVLITGANSYVGTNVEKWLMRNPDKYYVETLDMKDQNWKKFDFSKFDVVFHVAGIVHAKEKKISEQYYYDINTNLTIEVATKSIKSGVSQFIFMSSMSVYGIRTGLITEKTELKPTTIYGKSKLLAENQLRLLESDKTSISIVRPPLIYGHNSPGNLQKLSKFIKKFRIISDFKNSRSMIHICNFSNFIKTLIDNETSGIFHPQNNYYLSTMEICKSILSVNNMRYINLNIINPFLSILSKNLLAKLFGTLMYDIRLSDFYMDYCVLDYEKSIINMESGIYA
jgi:nucleoside-diphosphate-sugar epimerase